MEKSAEYIRVHACMRTHTLCFTQMEICGVSCSVACFIHLKKYQHFSSSAHVLLWLHSSPRYGCTNRLVNEILKS